MSAPMSLEMVARFQAAIKEHGAERARAMLDEWQAATAAAEADAQAEPVRYGAGPDAWAAAIDGGWADHLLPIMANPHVTISPMSKLAAVGKTPSQLDGNGLAVGVPGWTRRPTTDQDLARWRVQPDYGFCVRTGGIPQLDPDHFGGACLALDIDVDDAMVAADIKAYVDMHAPPTAVRFRGDSSRVVYLFRIEGKTPKRRFLAADTEKGAVELLGDGQQVVLAGRHQSGAHYEVADAEGVIGLPPLASIPLITRDQLEALWSGLVECFAKAGTDARGSDGVKLDKPRNAKDIDDPFLNVLYEVGAVIDEAPDGKAFVECPNKGHHSSDNGASQTAYMPKGLGGQDYRALHCMHQGCAGKPLLRLLAEAHNVAGRLTEIEQSEGKGPAAVDEFPVDVVAQSAADAIMTARRLRGDDDITLDDLGNARLMYRLSKGNLRYVNSPGEWVFWTDTRWERDPDGIRLQQVASRVADHYSDAAQGKRAASQSLALQKDVARAMQKEAEQLGKFASACRSKRALDAMKALAKLDADIALSQDALNTDPWLFGSANGVVDLRTGELRPDARDELVTHRSPVAFNRAAKAPRWEQFISEITAHPEHGARPAYARYLQKALGYSLTGVTAEHKMFIAIGGGANGKSVLLDIQREVMGDYGHVLQPEALMASRRDVDANSASPALAGLAGVRAAVSSESRDGQQLDSALIKRHTGENKLIARRLHQEPFTFTVTHKLWLMTNHAPTVDHLDAATRGRLHMLPFDMRWNRPGVVERNPDLPDGDKDLVPRLKAEAEGVLAWLVAGAVAYAQEGLEPPAEVTRMTTRYFAEQDPVARWLAECTAPVAGGGRGTGAAALYSAYTGWAFEEGENGGPGSQKAFAAALVARGVPKPHRMKAGMVYALALRTPDAG